jgi:hypothetical protein
MEERGTQREGQRGAMDQWEYRTFRFSMKAAEDPASYDRFGAEGWELAGITAITSTNLLTRLSGTEWVLVVFKRRITAPSSSRGRT